MPQLLDLSPEIIIAIAAQLLPEFDPDEPITDDFEERLSKTNRAALNSLSQTCRTLQRFVQPVLYRCPFTEDSHCLSLVRTIFQRPDLAKAVREMHIGAWKFEKDQKIPADDFVFFESQLAKYAKDSNGNPLPITYGWYQEVRGDLEPGGQETELCIASPDSALSALVATQIPNVERLRVYSCYSKRCFFCQPNSLPRLQYLSLAHCDDEMGVDLAKVKNICLAAPNLKQLDGFMIGSVSGPMPHENLRKLRILHSVIEEQELTPLITGFKSLESFTYESGGAAISYYPDATPEEISEALIQAKDTLRHVSIALQTYVDFDWVDDTCFRRFREMTNLETLTIYFSTVDFPDWNKTEVHADSLIKFLPCSIQEFTIGLPPWEFEEALLRLAKAVPEHFPRLKVLRLDTYGRCASMWAPRSPGDESEDEFEVKDVIREAFKARGVQASYSYGRRM